MTNIPIIALPGVCKVNSAYSNSIQAGSAGGKPAVGRYTDMDGTRFVAGMPEKLGGWTTALGTAITGTPRGLKDFRDYSQNVYLGIGTSKKLYYLLNSVLTDITPLRGILTNTLTNPLTTTSGSATVSVAHTAHGLSTGDYVKLVTGTAIGGIQPAGIFVPITRTDANNYTFVNISAATGSVSGGGGTVTYTYYRVTVATPLSTVINTPTVTVAHTAHGAGVGDYVTITGASAIGGITPSGNVMVATVPNANTWTFTWTSNATSTVNNAGGSPNFQYEITIGLTDAATTSGYSTGTYSSGGYSQSSAVGVTTPPRVWALSKYGQQLLASPIGGTIYIWDPTVGGRAYPLYNAPTSILWTFVTPERFVFALGSSTSNLMQIQWPDQNDYTNWTAAATNTANNGRTLQEGSYLVGGISPRDGVSLAFSNTAAYTFNYTGDNYVYTSNIAGTGCGLISPLSITSLSGVAFWMGYTEFWMWNGTVQPMPSDDIRDFIFTNINQAQSYKFCAGTNIAKKEIIFFYVSAASSEIDKYVIYHIDQNCWSTGTVLQRTSWIDRGLFSVPIATDASGYIYNQETGNDNNGMNLDSYIVFNPTTVAKGERNMDISAFFVDFERQTGSVSLTVNAQTYPQDTATAFGPYTIASDDTTPRIDLRVGAKMVGFKLESNVVGGDWRLGMPVVEGQIAGARR